MINQDGIKENFDSAVRHDRQEQNLKNNKNDAIDDRIKMLRGELNNVGGGIKNKLKQEIEALLEEEKKKLTSFIMNIVVGRWLKGLATGGLVPVLGFLPAMTAFFWWFVIKISNIQIKGIKINASLLTSLYICFFVLVQFFYILVCFALIYVLINPTGVLKEVLGV